MVYTGVELALKSAREIDPDQISRILSWTNIDSVYR